MCKPSNRRGCREAGLLTALVLCLMAQVSGVMAAEPLVIDIKGPAGDWVVQEATGRIFVSLPDENVVVEYDAQAKEVRRFPVGPIPTEMIIKGNRLIVACTKSPALQVIDLKDNRDLGSVSVNGRGPYALFCSQAENEYVYGICNPGSAWWDGEVSQIDLATMKIRKKTRVQPWRQSHPVHVAMSRDGTWLIPDARGQSSPSGADLMKVDEDQCTFTQLQNLHESFGPIVADPLNRYWTLGNILISLDLSKRVGTFAGTTVAIHPYWNLAVSLTADAVVLERFTDFQAIGKIPLTPVKTSPVARKTPTELQRMASFDDTVQFDLKKNLVVIGRGERVFIVDLREFSDKLERRSQMQIPSEVTTLVGKPLRIPVKLTDESTEATVTIARGPKAAQIREGHLHWTPTAEDVGTASIQLELKSADGSKVLDQVLMNVSVTLPVIELGFYARAMELSPDQKRLLVWGVSPGDEARASGAVGADECVLIDMDQRTILARAPMPQGIRAATLSNEFVFVSPTTGDLVYRMDHKLEQKERFFLPRAPGGLFTFPEKSLAVTSEGRQLQVYDTKSMQFDPVFQRMGGNVHPNTTAGLMSPLVLAMGGRIIDRKTGATLSVNAAGLLPSITGSKAHPGDRSFTSRFWGRKLDGQRLTDHRGSVVTQWKDAAAGRLSADYPLALNLRIVNPGRARAQMMIDLCDLVDGSVRQSLVINESSTLNPNRGPTIYDHRNVYLTVDDKILALQDKQLRIATIPESVIKAVPTPAHFGWQPPTEMSIDKPHTLTLQTGGTHEGVRYHLLSEIQGVTLDATTGVLTIDTPWMWKDFLTFYKGGNNLDARRNPPDFSVSENAVIYRILTGRELPADQFVTELPLSVLLRETDGQEDAAHFTVFVRGPRKEFETLLEQQRAEMARLREEQETKRQAAAELAARSAENGKNVDERLKDVETRLRRIEAALDSVLKRLDEKP